MSQEKFSSPKIAEEIKKKFGDDVKSFSGKVQYARDFNRFIKKMDTAHKKTEKSTLRFA
jgi:hypothetical protein